MPTVNQTEPEATNKSLEMGIEGNIRDLNRAGDEMAANTLATLLRRVYETSQCEIDNLIGELRGLREKLETDCDHLESDIAEYAKLSEGVVQLTATISHSVEILPKASHVSQ